MSTLIFGIPLQLGTGTWIVIIIAGLGFIIMFGISSSMGDYQGLVKTTLENDARSREYKLKNERKNQ
tara:strand:+ start:329 stop:529 length:201 start_codon:yes stop_codon:yes gene_type:complete